MTLSSDSVGRLGAETRQRAIRIALLEVLCGNLPGIILGSVLAGGVLAFVIDGVAGWVRVAWFAYMVLVGALRFAHLRVLRHTPTTGATVSRREAELTLLSAATALGWGVIGYLGVNPDTPGQSVIVIMLLTGLVASGTAFICHFRLMYGLYMGLIMGPVALRCLTVTDRDYMYIALLVVIYLVVSWITSRASSASTVAATRERFENLDRYTELLEEKARADDARRRAENANESKSVFLSAASHDLRQPLHSLRLFSATLQSRMSARLSREPDRDDSVELAEDHRLVLRIDESVTALEELFEGILDLSRLDAKTVEPTFEHIELASLFNHLELAHAQPALVKGISFFHDASNLAVYSDPVMLERLLTNLVSNAVRYTEQGTIRLTASLHDNRVVIKVIDTGIGISAEDKERIFGEFVQVNNPERDRRRGVGLGLSIVSRIAELLHANVRAESDGQGRGSTFIVDVQAGDLGAAQATTDTTAVDLEGSCPPGLFVVAVEDDESARAAMEALIQGWGGTILVAGSADEALAALGEIDEIPDILVSDYRLRAGETGTQAIHRLRAFAGEHVPGILVTGDVDAHRLRDINETGLPLLHKPVDPNELKRLINALLAQRE